MSYKYLVVMLLIFVCLNARADATSHDQIEYIVTAQGVVLTPTKSAVTRVAKEGLGVIPEIKRKQQLAWEEARRQETLRQQEHIKHIEAMRHAQELAEFQKQKAEAERREAARHAQEKEELLNKQDELKRTTALQILEKEKLLRVQEEARRREEARHAQEKVDMEARLVEAQRAQKKEQEIAREEAVTDDVLLLRAKLAEVEQQKNELLNALTSLKGGQVRDLGRKTSFIPYGGSYIHEDKLKRPNTALDDELKRKLASIISAVGSLLEGLDSDTTLRAVQKRLTKNQLERLKEGAENFEAPVFLRTFNEVQGGLPKLAESLVFKEIETMTKWLEEEREALSKVGEHRVYLERQLAVSKLVQERTAEFESFCEDYLDHIVADMCVWLAPTFTDEDAVKNTKVDFRSRLLTDSIPILSKYLNALTPFGTTDNFLTQTFLKIGKGNDYWKFKEVLQSYSTLFRDLGENVKLVEELLNYRFFQRRFGLAVHNLKSADLNSIKDLAVRKIVQEMVANDVLSYTEVKTSVFAARIPDALKIYMSKRAITAEESAIGAEVEKLLIAYSQIDAFSNNLRIGNPKIDEFHEE